MFPSSIPAGLEVPPGAPGGLVLPGGTQDNPLAIGLSLDPPLLRMPLTHMRSATAMIMDHMRQTTAPVTVVAEVDVTNLKQLRDWLKPQFEAQTGIPLTYTPFFARATVIGLQAYPMMNASMTPTEYVIPRFIHLGVAIQVPGAVAVPYIAHAETKTIPELAQELYVLAQRARSGQISYHDMIGQTFVITNPGKYGKYLFGTPTIKPPNVGILSFEAIHKRPVVLDNDELAVRHMMYISATADHRAVDGADVAGFVGKVKEVLEHLTL